MSKRRKVNEFAIERTDYAKSHAIAEREILPIVRKALRQTIAPVINYATVIGINGMDVETLIDKTVWQQMYLTIFQQLGVKFARKEFYRQRTLDGQLEQKASAIEFLLDIWTSRLREYALNYTYQIERELNETTVRIIKEALAGVYELGLDADGAIRLFIKELNGRFRMRAGTISRTESTTISNIGKDIGARGWIDQQGGNGYKAWLGRNDKRERHTHLEENNTVVEIDGFFVVGGEQAQRPGDVNLSAKERISCRCTATYMSINRYNALVKRGRIVGDKIIGTG